jgi:hypothetical protein
MTAEKETQFDWPGLYAVAARIDHDTKELASRVLDAILFLADGEEEPTLISRAKIVKRKLGKEGFDYSDGHVQDLYRTARWVSKQHENEECRWLEHRSFAAHQRARRRGWDWEKLILEFPRSKDQGDTPGKLGVDSLWKRILSETELGLELVDVGMRRSRGYEKRQLIIAHDDATSARDYAKKVVDRYENI